MRIMLTCRSGLNVTVGGMEAVYDNRAEELRRQGFDVHQVTGTGQYTDAYAQQCADAAVRLNPDIIHLDSFDDSRLWWAGFKRPGRCIACTIHGQLWGWRVTEWNQFLTNHKQMHARDWDGLRANARAQYGFDRLLTISKWEHLMARMFIGRFDAKLVYNPIHRRFFEQSCSAQARDGFIAFKSRWPGESSEAANRAGKPLRMLKGVAPDDMPGTYDSAQALLLPTYNAQGFDLVMAEALARRCPVICYGTGSYLLDELPGVVTVRMDDVQAMAEAMKRPLPDVPSDAAARFHPDAHVRAWLEAVS